MLSLFCCKQPWPPNLFDWMNLLFHNVFMIFFYDEYQLNFLDFNFPSNHLKLFHYVFMIFFYNEYHLFFSDFNFPSNYIKLVHNVLMIFLYNG